MTTRHLMFDEMKNGSFRCRDGLRGQEYGVAGSMPDAIELTIEWLRLQNYEGDVIVMVKPWQSPPFTEIMYQHTFTDAEMKAGRTWK